MKPKKIFGNRRGITEWLEAAPRNSRVLGSDPAQLPFFGSVAHVRWLRLTWCTGIFVNEKIEIE